MSPIHIISATYELLLLCCCCYFINVPLGHLAQSDYYLCGNFMSGIVLYICFPLVHVQYNFKLNYWYKFI